MALNPNIILSAAPFDPVGALDRGATAANRQNAFARETAYNQAISQNGAAAMRGDVNAQNALAGFDPNMVQGLQGNALGMEAQQLGMQATRQNMEIQREELAMRREQARVQTQQQLAEQQGAIDMAAAAEDAANLRKVLVGAAPLHAEGNEAQYNLFLQQNGIDPREYPMAEFPMNAATMEGVLDAIEGQRTLIDGPVVEPQEWRAATPQEAATFGAVAGQINTQTGKFDAAPMPRNQTTTIDPATGQVVITDSTGSGTGEPTVGQVYNPNEVASVVGMIDEIAQSPALGRVVGPIEGGGGNNIDDLGALSRTYYGGEGLGLIERIGQLQNNAWLSARQMLKGGGAITDYESRKAEGAVARLSRAKSEEEFRTALADLRSAIVDGQAKINAARGVAAPPQPAATTDAPIASTSAQSAIPPLATANGVTPEEWADMTDEEKRVWQQ